MNVVVSHPFAVRREFAPSSSSFPMNPNNPEQRDVDEHGLRANPRVEGSPNGTESAGISSHTEIKSAADKGIIKHDEESYDGESKDNGDSSDKVTVFETEGGGKYKDFSRASVRRDPVASIFAAASSKDPTFPVKLHQILSSGEFDDVIAWLPHGRSFRVLQPKAFEERVIPLFFRHGRYASFARQVNGWGFHRVTNGPDYGSYYHELFLRGLPHLCERMRRPSPGTIRKNKKENGAEPAPNFYEISEACPLPENVRAHPLAAAAAKNGSKAAMIDPTKRMGMDIAAAAHPAATALTTIAPMQLPTDQRALLSERSALMERLNQLNHIASLQGISGETLLPSGAPMATPIMPGQPGMSLHLQDIAFARAAAASAAVAAPQAAAGMIPQTNGFLQNNPALAAATQYPTVFAQQQAQQAFQLQRSLQFADVIMGAPAAATAATANPPVAPVPAAPGVQVPAVVAAQPAPVPKPEDMTQTSVAQAPSVAAVTTALPGALNKTNQPTQAQHQQQAVIGANASHTLVSPASALIFQQQQQLQQLHQRMQQQQGNVVNDTPKTNADAN